MNVLFCKLFSCRAAYLKTVDGTSRFCWCIHVRLRWCAWCLVYLLNLEFSNNVLNLQNALILHYHSIWGILLGNIFTVANMSVFFVCRHLLYCWNFLLKLNLKHSTDNSAIHMCACIVGTGVVLVYQNMSWVSLKCKYLLLKDPLLGLVGKDLMYIEFQFLL